MRRESGKPASAVTLVPMGRLPPELLRWLQERLHETLRRPVSVGKPVGLPPAAYHAQRQQYIGEAILAALRPLPLPPGTQAVALVDGDCYTPGLNFVFGQAARGGMMAFVALPRLRQSFYGLPEDPALFQERVLKEVIHELGHTWNLPHCPDARWR
ncbi:MAG: Peptidase family M54 [Chloroflexi bacterium ADurb.Bin180]|nr:MAG: Peptidase family M54 [Chloroflexi bacterium ADurb.Bin180]